MLAGSRYNEVAKTEVTIPEIYVLRHVHGGDDMVVDIKPLGREVFDPGEPDDDGKPTKPVLRTEAVERERLMSLYDPTGKFIRQEVFGIGQPLPSVLESVDNVIIPDKPARRTRKPKAPDALAEMVA